MEAIRPFPATAPSSVWRDLVMPKEHGSWSLAFEPVALGLLAAPTPAGAMFAVAVAAGFFARRPLGIAWREQKAERRAAAWTAVLVCGAVAALFTAGAVALGGVAWLGWLAPAALLGAVFLGFDLRRAGREEAAEVAGSAAFACLPAAFGALAGWPAAVSLALAAVMLGRAVPTVLCVRAMLRGAKTGEHRPGMALATAALALAAGVWLAAGGYAPWSAAALLGVLAVRAGAWLVFPRPALRARTLGMIEAVLGVAFVLVAGLGWNS